MKNQFKGLETLQAPARVRRALMHGGVALGALLLGFDASAQSFLANKKFAPTEVTAGSVADKAGLKSGDIIVDIAGQRVQVIRRDSKKLGILEFGTSVVAAADGSIAGLLGASPGASTAVTAMLDVLKRCFADRYSSWEPTLKEMVPSLGVKLSDEPELFREVWDHGSKVLGLGSGARAV